MPFEEGKEKTGGRAKGVPNKVTPEAKANLANIINDYLLSDDPRGLKQDLAAMRPIDRNQMLERWAKYVMPTLGSIKLEGNDDGEPVRITVTYVDEKANKSIDDEDSDKDYSETV